MTIHDFNILAKKILIGIFIFLVPAIIIIGGLTLTSQLLNKKSNTAINSTLLKK